MLSIIITTKNEEKNIRRLIKSIKKNCYLVYEILVIDNFSTDHTQLISKEEGAIVYNFGPERSAQRNYGAKISKYSHLLFLDADMEVNSKIFFDEVKNIIKSGAKAAYIRENIIKKGIIGKIRNYERQLYDITENNCPRFIDKNLFFEIGCFNINLTGFEDWELNNKIKNKNYKILHIKEKINHYEEEMTFIKTAKKKAYYLFNSQKLGNEYKNQHQTGIVFRIIGIYFYRENFLETLKNPFIFILTFLYKNIQILLIVFLYFFKKNKFIKK